MNYNLPKLSHHQLKLTPPLQLEHFWLLNQKFYFRPRAVTKTVKLLRLNAAAASKQHLSPVLFTGPPFHPVAVAFTIDIHPARVLLATSKFSLYIVERYIAVLPTYLALCAHLSISRV